MEHFFRILFLLAFAQEPLRKLSILRLAERSIESQASSDGDGRSHTVAARNGGLRFT